MNERTANPEDVEAAEPVAPAPVPVLLPVPGRKRVRRGRIAAVAGAVVLVGAVVAGTSYTVVTVRNADRDAGEPSWKFPKAVSGHAEKPKPASPLAALLVPYDDAHLHRGPDIAGFGTDAALNGGAATALSKQSLRDLPRSQRREIEKRIDKQHIKGIAMRSYLNVGSTIGGAATYTAEIELSQIEDRRAVRNMSTLQNEFLDALKVFRSGPKIEGHKTARCFLPPTDKKEKLDMMFCSGYQGDVLVSATAFAAKPLDTKRVAQLFREQLDRIQEPGEAV
ncbi:MULTISPECIES: hypothetical protein [unclassified Streptomyces]|uniref:hypothetical protein n=1 Tax=unclassified Streptomyces TaxID=2593676 RepID=UPI003441B83B